MDEVLIPVATLLVGALLGFFLRSREFRREQRLKVYGEFVAAFLDAARVGADLLSLYFTFGESLYNENATHAAEPWKHWAAASKELEAAAARLRIVSSKRVRTASEELEDFFEHNVRALPPFRRGEPEPSEWGEAAQVGPAHVARVAIHRARKFADVAARDVTLWREH